MFQGFYCLKNISDSVFLFRYYEEFSSPLSPLVSAIVTWMFWGVKENVTKLLHLFQMPFCVPSSEVSKLIHV